MQQCRCSVRGSAVGGGLVGDCAAADSGVCAVQAAHAGVMHAGALVGRAGRSPWRGFYVPLRSFSTKISETVVHQNSGPV